MGDLPLDKSLKFGECRYLSKDEISLIKTRWYVFVHKNHYILRLVLRFMQIAQIIIKKFVKKVAKNSSRLYNIDNWFEFFL
jgi:hypothetical protein